MDAHQYYQKLGKLFEFTSTFLHFYLETGSRKAPLFNPHSGHLAVRFCVKKTFLSVSERWWAKAPSRSWDTSQDTPEHLWNFFQVPLVESSQSIFDGPKEGLCFLGYST